MQEKQRRSGEPLTLEFNDSEALTIAYGLRSTLVFMRAIGRQKYGGQLPPDFVEDIKPFEILLKRIDEDGLRKVNANLMSGREGLEAEMVKVALRHTVSLDEMRQMEDSMSEAAGVELPGLGLGGLSPEELFSEEATKEDLALYGGVALNMLQNIEIVQE